MPGISRTQRPAGVFPGVGVARRFLVDGEDTGQSGDLEDLHGGGGGRLKREFASGFAQTFQSADENAHACRVNEGHPYLDRWHVEERW